jgi:hypothetical protein
MKKKNENDTKKLEQVEKLFRKSVEFCNESDIWWQTYFNFFPSSLMKGINKLDRLSLASLESHWSNLL